MPNPGICYSPAWTSESLSSHKTTRRSSKRLTRTCSTTKSARTCLAAYLSDPNCIMVVALAGDLVVGQMRAMIHLHPDRPAELYLDNAGVAPAFQRRGIATRLFAEIARIGKERGCRDVWLGTEADNEAAKAFYRSLALKMEPMVMFHGDLQ